MSQHVATVLGCGVAGSWLAHHAVAFGFQKFVLFDPGSDRETLRTIGPLISPVNPMRTCAESLAKHLLAMNPDLEIETYGAFDLEHGSGAKVEGTIFAAMSKFSPGVDKCGGVGAFATNHHPLITLGLPTTSSAKIWWGKDLSGLTEDHFGGPPVISKYEAMLAAAQALGAILDSK